MPYRHIKFDSVMGHAAVTLMGLGARIILWSLGSLRSSGLIIVTPPPRVASIIFRQVLHINCEVK